MPTTNEEGERKPSQILNLKNWKLTLPVGNPTEITNLEGYSDSFFFVLKDSVVFRCSVNGATTSGSSYPRCELREMKGGKKASWSTQDSHSMYIEQAITHLPDKKRHVVAGQVHDAEDDVLMIRLENKKLFIEVDGDDVETLDDNYELGRLFSIKFESGHGVLKIYYNGKLSYSLAGNMSGLYFKAGCYTQSNCKKEDACSANNYGEVIVYKLELDNSLEKPMFEKCPRCGYPDPIEVPEAPKIKMENQLDPKWKNHFLGRSKSGFNAYGCKLFVLTYLYSVKMGKQVSPDEVNDLLYNGGAYFSGDMLEDVASAKALGLQFLGRENDINKMPNFSPTMKEVDFSIADGKQQHFVARIIKPEGTRAILDPYEGVERVINYYEKKVKDLEWTGRHFSYRLFKV